MEKVSGNEVFSEEKLEEILILQDYKELIREVCSEAIKSPRTTYVLLERYTYINGFAGSAVALLAGNIGYSRDLFRDLSTEIVTSSDRGMMIAPKILAATIDEHADRQLGQSSHRALAQVCLNSIADYAGLSNKEREVLDGKSQQFLDVVEKFKLDYKGKDGDAKALIRSIGYHIASEFLADIEYKIKDEEIWFKHPDDNFRDTVKRGRKEDGTWYGPWAWITAHAHYSESEEDLGYGLEHDHFIDAISAFDLAIKFKPSDLSNQDMLDLVFEGMKSFRSNWDEFYRLVLQDIKMLS